MALDQNIGMVTAYAYAVSKGYTGTEEQFAQELASAGADLSQIQTQIDNFINTIVPAKTAEVTAEGTRQIGLVAAEGTAQKNAVTAEGTTQKNAVISEGTTQKNAVNSAGSTQVNAVNSAGSTQVGNVNTAGSTQVGAVQAKGQEVLNSIPSDYTELSDDVDDLKSALFDGIIENVEYAYTDVTWVDGKYVAYNGGNKIENADYSYCEISFAEGSTNLTGYTNAAPGSIIGLAFYDNDGAYISGDRSNNTGRYDYNFDLEIPANAKKVAISCRTAYINTFNCVVSVTSPSIQAQLTDIEHTLDDGFNIDTNYENTDVEWTDGYYVTYDAAHFIAQESYSYCKISLDNASTKLIGKTDTAPNSLIGLSFVDEIGNYIAGDRSTNTGRYDYVFNLDIPENARTVYISCRTDYKTNFYCTVENDYPSVKAQTEYFTESKKMYDGVLGTGNITYYGDKITIEYEKAPKKCQVNLWKNFLGSEIANLSQYRLHVCQSLAVFNGYMFCMCADGTFAVVDMDTKTLIYNGTYTPSDHQHANSSQFSNIYYSADDEFPLLLVSRCGNNSGETLYDECLVYRVTRSGSNFTLTLINSIVTDFQTYGESWAIDNVSNILYLATYTKGSWKTQIEGNQTIIYAFPMPNETTIKSGAEITLSKGDAIATMLQEKVVFQSMTANGGKLYLGTSHGNGLEGFYCIDFWGNKIASKVYMPDTYEVEGVTIYDGKIYVDQTKGTDTEGVNPMKVYELVF